MGNGPMWHQTLYKRTWWSLWREKWAVWNLRRRSNVLELPKVSGMFSEDVWMFWRPSMYLVCAIDFRNFSKFVISFAFGEEFCDTLPLMLVLFLFSIARDSLQKNTMESKPSWCQIWIKLINFTRYWKEKIRKYVSLEIEGVEKNSMATSERFWVHCGKWPKVWENTCAHITYS